MATKIRLARGGSKRRAYYHISVADARAPRDGKFIERIGNYNPNTNPATIDLDFESALKWVQNGAQPTDTVRAILSYKGVLYKNHLLNGVKKGALTEAQVEEKFNAWLAEKEGKITAKTEGLSKAEAEDAKNRLAAEAEANKKREEAIAAKNTPEVEEAPAAEENTTEGEETAE
jgi:small subunit ribosomal protein S16